MKRITVFFALFLISSAQAQEIPSAALPAPAPPVESETLYQAPEFADADSLVLTYEMSNAEELSTLMRERLSGQIIMPFQDIKNSRIEVYAFASADGGSENAARRLSFSRALQVRDFLLSQGVQQQDILLYPLGDLTQAVPKDQIKVLITPVGGV